MELKIDRAWKRDSYTISRFFVDGKRFCESVEDVDRGLKQTDSLAHIKALKVPKETAIPTGRYKVTMGIVSPKFSLKKDYSWCKGRLPRLINVPGFDGILIHAVKSASRLIGVSALSKEAAELESAADEGRTELIAEKHQDTIRQYLLTADLIRRSITPKETDKDMEETIMEFYPEEDE